MAISQAIEQKLAANSVKFVDRAHSQFLKATKHDRQQFHYFQVANFVIRLWFANETLVDIITPSLAHLAIKEPVSPADLTICLWDSASTQTPEIAPSLPNSFYSDRGELIYCNNERVFSLMDPHTRALSLFDKQTNRAMYWVKSVSDLPWWASGSPLQYLLHWWSFDKGFQLTHAASLGHDAGGVVIAGKSGSGKSTTTLLCLQQGMRYLSEDYCLLQENPTPHIYSVYNSAKLEQKTLDIFPDLKKYIVNTNRQPHEKALLFQQQIYPEKILKACPLKAMLVSVIDSSRPSWLEPISIENMMPALAVSTMWQLIRSGTATFNRLKNISQSVPCYRLHLGTDLANIPTIVEKLL